MYNFYGIQYGKALLKFYFIYQDLNLLFLGDI